MTEAQIQKAAMLTMRLWGDWLTQKIGQKTVVLGGSMLAFLGFVLIITMNVQILLYIGFFLVGIGCANVVPIFYALLGKQHVMPIRLAVPAVSTLGYLGVLMVPAAIGFIAHQTSLYAAFGFLAGLVLLQAVIAAYVYRHILDGSFVAFDADPAMLFFDMNRGESKAGGAEDFLEGLWGRIIEMILLDVFLHFCRQALMAVNLGDEQERAARLEHARDFLEIFRRVGPEVEAFDGRDFVKALVSERERFDGALDDVHFARGNGLGIRLF